MGEWWTYRLEDFLMFAPRTYWRLIELYNRDTWPLQLLTLAAGIALVGVAAKQGARARSAVAALLALAWLWVGWAFHWQRYASINWGARYLAAAFLVQALLLIAAAAWLRPAAGATPVAAPRFGLLLAAVGVLLYPFVGISAGRPMVQAEVFGLVPEPTALATLGLLLATTPPKHAWLAVIPLTSLVVGGLTAWLLAN
jgi:hypothetical protein